MIYFFLKTKTMNKSYKYEKLESPVSSPRTCSTYVSSGPNTPGNTPTKEHQQMPLDLSMKKNVKKELNFSIKKILS